MKCQAREITPSAALQLEYESMAMSASLPPCVCPMGKKDVFKYCKSSTALNVWLYVRVEERSPVCSLQQRWLRDTKVLCKVWLCGTFTKLVLFYVFAELRRCYPLYSWHGQTGTRVNLMFQPGAAAAVCCDWSYLSSPLLDSAQWPFPSMACLPEQCLDFSSQSDLIGSKRHFS